MTEFERNWLDAASYEALLTKLRQEPIGSPWLSNDVGIYLADRLSFKRRQMTEAERIEISKRVKWNYQRHTE